MSESMNEALTPRARLGFLEKLAAIFSWFLGGAVFFTVGRLAMAPADPRGAVSLLLHEHPLWALLQVHALAVVTSALAAVIAGRFVSNVGTFAAALGLLIVALRGETAAGVLIFAADQPSMSGMSFGLKLALETLGWFSAILAAHAASFAASRWIHGKQEEDRAADVPGLTHGLLHALSASIISIAGMTIFSSGLSDRAITHGQSCFVVAAGVMFGAYFAGRTFPVRSAFWSLLSAPALGMIGYLWSAVRAPAGAISDGLTPTHFLRVLPIEYIAAGTAAAIIGFWYAKSAMQTEPDEDRSIAS